MGISGPMRGTLNLGGLLAVAGAVAIVVGLSLDWFEPGISAWTAFEVVDLLLAAIAVGVVVVALWRSPSRPRVQAAAGWLPVLALVALALVVAALVNPPPGAIDRSLEIGAWVSLGGAILLVIGAILTTTEVSVMVTMRPRPRERSAHAEEAAATDPLWDPAEEPFDEPPTDERAIGDPVDDFVEPLDEGAAEIDPDLETRPLPRREPE